MRSSSFARLVVALLIAGSAQAVGANERGSKLLQSQCQRCHAIGVADESSHPQAPPFRSLVKRYPAENLEEALAEGIVSGHPDMPVVSFTPVEIGAIVDYLNDLSARAP